MQNEHNIIHYTLTGGGTQSGVLTGGANAQQGAVADVILEHIRTAPVALGRTLFERVYEPPLLT